MAPPPAASAQKSVADDLSLRRHARHANELDPLHVTDDGEAHAGSLTAGRRRALERMMDDVRLPPFERFYEQHRDEVFRLLARRLGRERAEDAFQETFLRALRAYPSLRHGGNLRAWVLTIAERIAIDDHRRSRPAVEPPEQEMWPERPAYAELEHLAADLPPTERAAVVLRYGYDLDYEQIGAVLGSSAEAARQAASSGVRSLRRKEGL